MKNQKNKGNVFLASLGVFFITFVAILVILSSIPSMSQTLEDGTKQFTSDASTIIVILPLLFSVVYGTLEKNKKIKNKQSKAVNTIQSNKSPVVETFEQTVLESRTIVAKESKVNDIYSKEKKELTPKFSTENNSNTISVSTFSEMIELQKHRIKLQKYKESIIDQKAKFEQEKFNRETELEEREDALRKTEFTIIDWVSRMEKKEQDVFDEIYQDAEKFRTNHIQLNGYDFEEYIANLLRLNKYENVCVTKKSSDYGADVLAEKSGIRYVFQCKYYTSVVGIASVQQVYAAKDFYNTHVAVVVTNSIFTKAAKTLANELKVILWDCEKVNNLGKAEKLNNVKTENG